MPLYSTPNSFLSLGCLDVCQDAGVQVFENANDCSAFAAEYTTDEVYVESLIYSEGFCFDFDPND
jgi:hypothetical protein